MESWIYLPRWAKDWLLLLMNRFSVIMAAAGAKYTTRLFPVSGNIEFYHQADIPMPTTVDKMVRASSQKTNHIVYDM